MQLLEAQNPSAESKLLSIFCFELGCAMSKFSFKTVGANEIEKYPKLQSLGPSII